MQGAGRQVPSIFSDDRPGQIDEEDIDAGVLEALGWRAAFDLEDGLRRLHKHMSAGDDKRPVAEAYKLTHWQSSRKRETDTVQAERHLEHFQSEEI